MITSDLQSDSPVTRNGCGAVVYEVRRFIWIHNDGSQFDFLSLDLSNAFNVVLSRAAFLNCVEEHFPTLLARVS